LILFLGLAWASLVALLLVRAVRQFQAYEVLTPSRLEKGTEPFLTAIVPARNEAANIGACVSGLLQQGYPSGRMEAIVVDDNSTDATSGIVLQLARKHPWLRVISAGPLPEGWSGKPHACWQAARTTEGEWLCFLDADTVPAPALFSSAVAFAEDKGIDMLSLEPFQVLGSFWERLILPSGLFMIAFFAPSIASINNPEVDTAAANGQFILIRRRVYEAVGGHRAVGGEIAEDGALATLVKKSGYRTCLMGGKDLIRVRMFTSLAEIWEGLSKNALDVVKGSRAAVLTAFGGLLVAWLALLLPLGAWLALPGGQEAGSSAGLALAILGSLALFCTHVAGARYFRVSWWYGLLFPIGYTMVAAIVFNSVRSRATGDIRWKGRVYRTTPGGGVGHSEPGRKGP
jgi:chlorobactene glucosyltransferase